ncbi:MAG: YkyA family protein [Planococcaceae bacterium]|nr:YkyA family protein [Bacillota bacterium]MDX1770148.1 YkyA family protein [Planococcaceae bacterium]
MKKGLIGLVLSSTIVLSGCTFGASAHEQLSEALSTVFEEEKGYRDAQKELASLEKKEQETFNEVMALTQEDTEKVKTLVSELNDSVEQRLALLEEEKQSMKNAEEKVSAVEDVASEVKDEKSKTSIKELDKALDDRYAAHDKVSTEYEALTEKQTVLYEMLLNEETKQEDLQKQVAEVNSQNEKVQEAIQTFNDSTIAINELKSNVYSTLSSEK